MAAAPEPRNDFEPEAPDVRFADSWGFPQLVRTFWEVHGTFPHVRERVLPTTDIFVLINLGAPHVLISGNRERIYSDAWVSGIQQLALLTGALGRTDVWGARLTPYGAEAAFGATAALADRVLELSELMGRAGVTLAASLRDAATFEGRCQLFEHHLATMLHQGRRRWRPEVAWAFGRITAGTSSRIVDVAAEIGWSRKHLHSQFVDHFGHGPKAIARIARFERALQFMSADADSSLAAVALSAGYYDQAQFAREFRALAGITPTAYAKSRVAGVDYGFVDADG